MKPTLLILYLMLLVSSDSRSQETHVINWHPGVKPDIEVNVGDTVKWYVSQKAIVDVKSDVRLPDFGSVILDNVGDSYAYVFNKPGNVNFYSSTYPKSMRGNINVRQDQSDQQEDFSFKIYPNPVKDRIFFDDKNRSKKLDVTIYDVLGKVVKKDNLNGLTIRNGMDVSNLKRGVYLVQIDNGANSFTQKLVKN